MIALFKIYRVIPFILIVLLASGCSHLQPVDLPPESTPDPSHSAIWNALDADHHADWFVLLNDGPSALDWRLRAIDSASESIDLQTFLWNFDVAGSMVLDHLVLAAERGVKVKLLIDDTFLAGEDKILLELADHENIEYRVYNPFKRRFGGAISRWALNLGEFSRLNHRMHNKAMVVDNRVAIVGGRNLADEYFGLHSEANFRDMELIVGGPIVQSITQSFDEYWNDHWSIPINMLSHITTTQADLEAARHVRGQNQHLHEEVSQSERISQWQTLINSSLQGEAVLLVDQPPERAPDEERDKPVQVADALADLFANAEQEILIISAYLIPTERLESHVAEAIERGVRVRILTNSIASNNHLAAHSAYRNHIATLLGHGAELHEVKVDAEDRRIYMLEPVQRKILALHAKALVIDNDKVFIGSANLDPRSLRINTEMGLLVTSSALNSALRKAVMPDFDARNAWQLKYDGNGVLVWESDDTVLSVQPAVSFMQRIEDWFFSHLPIEGEL